MKICTVIWGQRSKIEFVRDKNLITSFSIYPQFLKICITAFSKRYNSVPVKDNCAPFAPTFLFSGPGYPMVSFKFFPCRFLLPWQRIFFGTKIEYNSLFSPTPLFSGSGYPMASFKFLAYRPLLPRQRILGQN